MSRRAYGLKTWIWQRLSAVYLALYIGYFVSHLLFFPPQSGAEWSEWISDTPVLVATLLFYTALLLHAWIGVRDILIDYVHAMTPRLILLSMVAIALLAMGVWVIVILLGGR